MLSRPITRFAPSPTGFLHIGGVRTALYCWLLARQQGGVCILRIEDTDSTRSTAESAQQILDSLAWLEMDFDVVHYQSHRFAVYRDAITNLLEAGRAYVCDCSSERLDALREAQLQARHKPRYDGTCRQRNLALAPGRVVRLLAPVEGSSCFRDAIYGRICVANAELDDMIIQRSDGSPTYNFCCALDDHLMDISLVIRGDDHINNTPRQLHVYQALGLAPPQFAHLPMILGSDGKRLSKRHGAQGVLDYRNQGLLPDAVMNYLARLGWSHGNQEIFSRDQLIGLFGLDKVSRSAAMFSQDKLLWTNKQHLKLAEPQALLTRLEALGRLPDANRHNLLTLIDALRQRVHTLDHLANELAPYVQDAIDYQPEAASKHLVAEAVPVLQAVRDGLAKLDDWSEQSLHQLVTDTAEQLGIKMGRLGMPLRVAVTGRGFSPALDLTLKLIGKKRVLARLDAAIAYIKAGVQPSPDFGAGAGAGAGSGSGAGAGA